MRISLAAVSVRWLKAGLRRLPNESVVAALTTVLNRCSFARRETLPTDPTKTDRDGELGTRQSQPIAARSWPFRLQKGISVMLFETERQSTAQMAAWGARLPAALSRWWPIPIRLIMGYGFAAHGFAKLARGPDHFAGILSAMGVPEAHFMSLMVIFFEIFGGLSLMLGALVPLFALPMIVILLFAALTVHLPYGFSSVKLLAVTPAGAQFGQPGYETDLLYIAGILSLVVGGSGPYAADNYLTSWIARRRV